MERKLGPYFAMLVALLGGALVVVTVSAYFLSTFCWEYCEPEDEPTAWDGLEFALPFGIAAIGVMTAAAYLFMIGPPLRRGSWRRALAIAVGSCVAGGLLFAGFAAWYDKLPNDAVVWLAGAALVIGWEALTAVVARALALRAEAPALVSRSGVMDQSRPAAGMTPSAVSSSGVRPSGRANAGRSSVRRVSHASSMSFCPDRRLITDPSDLPSPRSQ